MKTLEDIFVGLLALIIYGLYIGLIVSIAGLVVYGVYKAFF